MEYWIGMDTLLQLSSNKIFVGIALLLMNMGSRYVMADLNKVHEALLSSELFKKIILFCMCFVGTRDVMTAVILTFAFSIVIKGLLNAKSRFNILPRSMLLHAKAQEKAEYERAKEFVLKYEARSQ